MASSQFSLSPPNPTDSSAMSKLKAALMPKNMFSKNPKNLKSKTKQVASDNSRKSISYKRKRTSVNDLYDNLEAKFTVMERAGGVLANLATKYPSFAKCMLPSNVAHGFWLILPKKFCNLHLPRHDATITLVDEWGNEYKTNYLLERHGLSAGWRGFSIGHRLLKGDILVFHLAEPCKLKVHIVRVNCSEEISAALCLMNLDAFGKSKDFELAKGDNRTHKKAKKSLDHLLLDNTWSKEHIQKNTDSPEPPGHIQNSLWISNSSLGPVANQSENSTDDIGSEDSEMSNLQSSELCCYGSTLLHGRVRKGITCS